MTDTTPTSDSVRDKLIDLRMNKDWLKANEGQYTRDDWWQFCADESTMTLVEVLEFVESQLQAYKASVEREIRIDEHYKMIDMIKATDMETQLREYWHAGNYRLAELDEVISIVNSRN